MFVFNVSCQLSPTGYKPRLQRHSKPLKGTQSAEAHAHFIPFLSWFAYHKTRAWNGSEKRIRNTLNKTCRAELVTSRNLDYRLYSIPEHSFFIYYWEFSDGFVQGKPNIDEYFWIRSSVEVRNDTESAWIIVEDSRSRKLDFPNICSLFHQFPNIYNDYLHSNVIDSFFLFW